MVYEELVKRCRDCIDCLCGECKYKHLQKPGNFVPCMNALLGETANAIEELQQIARHYEEESKGWWLAACDAKEERERLKEQIPKWIPVTERLPECDLGAEVGNIEWISNGMVHAGCFGRGGKYRDAYFRTWTDAGEGMDAKDADYWRAVTLPEQPKEES